MRASPTLRCNCSCSRMGSDVTTVDPIKNKHREEKREKRYRNILAGHSRGEKLRISWSSTRRRGFRARSENRRRTDRWVNFLHMVSNDALWRSPCQLLTWKVSFTLSSGRLDSIGLAEHFCQTTFDLSGIHVDVEVRITVTLYAARWASCFCSKVSCKIWPAICLGEEAWKQSTVLISCELQTWKVVK